jgi:lysine decarboxylase
LIDNKQNKTPFFTKLKEYAENKDIVSFDVPGHKLGRVKDDLYEYLGEKIYRLDSNSPRGLDNLSKPKGVIKESSELVSSACNSDNAYFLTGGTSQGILGMIIASVKAKEKIILPRNVHKSIISALIFSGAIPIFMEVDIDTNLGIANQVNLNTVKKTIDENPDASAILIINPTYFGVCSDILEITNYAHEYNITVLIDEAHGAHFYFYDKSPLNAMQVYADASAISFHKLLGSLTESSVLITKGLRIDNKKIKATINMLQSTSPNHLLIASIDTTRKYFVNEGYKLYDKLVSIVNETRNKINKIKGLSSPGKQYFINAGATNFDETKLIINCSKLGLSGFDIYKELKDNYNIQVELAEPCLILCAPSIGNNESDFERLVDALKDISKNQFQTDDISFEVPKFTYKYPSYFTRPREADHAPYNYSPRNESIDEKAAEMIMIYPPGIPIVIPGEVIDIDILNNIIYYQNSDSVIIKDSEDFLIKVIDKEKWVKYIEGVDDEL